MAFDREKFKALVHYVCSKTDPAKLGSTKLNKACWLADFISYYRTGKAITDAAYIKRQFGPVPRAILSTLSDLEKSGDISVTEKLYYGKIQKQFRSLKPPNMARLLPEEIRLIDGITNYVAEKHTAASISELSHDHVWKAAHDGEEIPYFTVFANPAPVSEIVRQWAMQEIEDMQEITA